MLQLQNEDGTAATHFRLPNFAFPLCSQARRLAGTQMTQIVMI
jgi:hypothetical protein